MKSIFSLLLSYNENKYYNNYINVGIDLYFDYQMNPIYIESTQLVLFFFQLCPLSHTDNIRPILTSIVRIWEHNCEYVQKSYVTIFASCNSLVVN